MAQGTAVVKAVTSGDTLILMGRANNGPPPEIQITLSSVLAPRLARGPEQVDEPFAWESREHLRRLCIGKTVQFRVEYRVDSIKRDFGSVTLADGPNLAVAQAAAGMVTVKTVEQCRDGVGPHYEEISRAGLTAAGTQAGLHAGGEGEVRRVTWGGFGADQMLEECKGRLMPAVVEQVRDGATLRVLLTDSMTVVTVMLAGVQCARLPRVQNVVAPPPAPAAGAGGPPSAASIAAGGATGAPAGAPVFPPYSREAKYFTEVRLLNRDVNVRLQGVDKFGSFFGVVVHPAGDIGELLLKNGFARVADWSMGFAGSAGRNYRALEREAKMAQLRVWQGYQAPAIRGERQFEAKVVEVVSGDTLVLLPEGAQDVRTVHLSSIRTPRLGRRGDQDEPWAHEAKELLRNRLIGRNVRVHIDYTRTTGATPEGEGGVERVFATILVGKASKAKNAAELLLADGLAEVQRHRQDDERSPHYDALLQAESAGRTAGRGRHGSKDAPVHRVTDLTIPAMAKQYTSFLMRQRSQRGVVEYVASGSRFKIFIPSENSLINFALVDVRTPAAGGANRRAEPMGNEARHFSKLQLMQRSVELEIMSMDKNGCAYGRLFVGGGDQRKAFSGELVSRGLATLDDRALERGHVHAAVVEAADRAKEGRVGVWEHILARQAEAERREAEASGNTQGDPMANGEDVGVRLSEIRSGGHFFLHLELDETLAEIEGQLREFKNEHGTSGAPVGGKRGDVVAALFDEGSGPQWFRAKLLAHVRGLDVEVLFLDYGNVATLPVTRLRPLAPELLRHTPQARESVLAMTRVEALGADWGEDAAYFLNSMAWGRSLVATVVGRDGDNRLEVALYDPAEPASVNERLIRAGLARTHRYLSQAARESDFGRALEEAQEDARSSRRGMWCHGDVGDDDPDTI